MQLHVASFEVHNNCVHDLLHSRRVEGVVVDDPVAGPVECGVSRHPIDRMSQVRLAAPHTVTLLPSCTAQATHVDCFLSSSSFCACACVS
jgi:hypothetical protein